MSQPNTEGRYGVADAAAGGSQYNALMFLIRQALAGHNTATLVQVKAVTNSGGLEAVGFVDVLPLVNQLDGQKNAVPHAVVYNLPYFRLQGGANAVILDPQVGDIGLAVFADRDISAVKASKAQANPGSMRRTSYADGLYVGGFLNGAPTQYVQFGAGGITLSSPTKITLNAPLVEINASASLTANAPQSTLNSSTLINGSLSQGTGSAGGGATMAGPVAVTNDVTAGGKSLMAHVHSGVLAGGANTGAPV